jgi:hypothetical protein
MPSPVILQFYVIVYLHPLMSDNDDICGRSIAMRFLGTFSSDQITFLKGSP